MTRSKDERTYRFGDATRPGLLLGLAPRQAAPLVVGVLVLAGILQSPIPPVVGLLGPAGGLIIAFGRVRGAPLSECLVPGLRLVLAGRRRRWIHHPIGSSDLVPTQLAGLSLVEAGQDEAVTLEGAAVVDRVAGTVSGVVRVGGHGFPLASSADQAGVLAGWGAALAPCARDRSPVTAITWQAWARPSGPEAHRDFLAEVGVDPTSDDPATADYLALIDDQGPVTVAHEVLLTVTVDIRRVRVRRGSSDRLAAALDALTDEIRTVTARIEATGLSVEGPFDRAELSAAVRIRSDPRRAHQVATLSRSLAAAAGRVPVEWAPMVVEPAWTCCRVDGAYHRSYRVAGWPQLPVPADWLGGLVGDGRAVRTVTVVMEPVPLAQAARAADREVMAREADADMRQERGFRVGATDRKRLAEVEARERELSEGHPEFRFAAVVDVVADGGDGLDDACAEVEQAAAQSLLDLRPLDSRHDLGWVASLPLGRTLRRRA
jgi:hypothetical protein